MFFVVWSSRGLHTPGSSWEEVGGCAVGGGQLRRQMGLPTDLFQEGEFVEIEDQNMTSLKNICALGSLQKPLGISTFRPEA